MDDSPTASLRPTTSSSPPAGLEVKPPGIADHPNENISFVENKGTGDAWQIIVSTNGNNIHGKNEGDGWRTRQLAGNCSDATVQQVSRDMVNIGLQNTGNIAQNSQARKTPGRDDIREHEVASEYTDRYGRGYTTSGATPSLSASTKRTS